MGKSLDNLFQRRVDRFAPPHRLFRFPGGCEFRLGPRWADRLFLYAPGQVPAAEQFRPESRAKLVAGE